MERTTPKANIAGRKLEGSSPLHVKVSTLLSQGHAESLRPQVGLSHELGCDNNNLGEEGAGVIQHCDTVS